MKINHEETAIKCKLLNQAELARQCGVTPPVVSQVIRGVYTHMQGRKAQLVVSRLRDLGYLIEEPEDLQVAA